MESPECVTNEDCSANNLPGIAKCNYLLIGEDTNLYTWDYRENFISQCINGACTVGDETVTHTCDVVQCSALCDLTHPCADGKTCLSDCTCV